MRALFAELFDDAALFPPGNAPMREAVPAHSAYRAAWYADLIGPFICPDNRLADCDGRVPVSVIVTGGPTTLGDALRQLPAGQLAAVEIPIRHDTTSAAEVMSTLPTGVPAYLEVPFPQRPPRHGRTV